MMAFKFILSVTLLSYVYGLRVSPKLDFGEAVSVNSGFRPIAYENDQTFEKENANFMTTKRDVICDQSNYNTTNFETASKHGISTDVLVHIRTNIHLNESKNGTIEPVPDVPIIVGTKDNKISSSNLHFGGFSDIIPAQVDLNYPSNRESLYSEFQSIPNFQKSRLIPVVNNIHAPELSWYPSRRYYGANRNPVEFKKTYNINRMPLIPSQSDLLNSNTPSVPCVCDNRGLYNTPIIPSYFSRNEPAGINEKLNPLD